MHYNVKHQSAEGVWSKDKITTGVVVKETLLGGKIARLSMVNKIGFPLRSIIKFIPLLVLKMIKK